VIRITEDRRAQVPLGGRGPVHSGKPVLTDCRKAVARWPVRGQFFGQMGA
jgi:hypothetical protein